MEFINYDKKVEKYYLVAISINLILKMDIFNRNVSRCYYVRIPFQMYNVINL
jgi:hypothetical protein